MRFIVQSLVLELQSSYSEHLWNLRTTGKQGGLFSAKVLSSNHNTQWHSSGSPLDSWSSQAIGITLQRKIIVSEYYSRDTSRKCKIVIMKMVECAIQYHRRKSQEHNELYIITILECHINDHTTHWKITFLKAHICILPFLSPFQEYSQCMRA